MRTFHLVAQAAGVSLLAGSLCWGQAISSGNSDGKPMAAPSTVSVPGHDAQNPAANRAVVAPGEPVISINGLCDSPPQSNRTNSDCKTIITRAEFETIVAAIQPNMSVRAKPEFASQYADALVMVKKAQELGLDKGAAFDEQMKVARVEILVRELKNLIRSESDQVSEKQIADYYNAECCIVPRSRPEQDLRSGGSGRFEQQGDGRERGAEAAGQCAYERIR